VDDWLEGKKKPTVKQLEAFANKVHVPFGYFFLDRPPIERMPIPFFRTLNQQDARVGLNVIDTILLMQQRQAWLRDYLKDNEFDPLPFVRKFSTSVPIDSIVGDLLETIGFETDWASRFKTWEEALEQLTNRIEALGIIIVFNSIVENNTHRPIPVEACRGFVLVDEYAPFMFVNSADAKAAQMFTIVHELAHIWVGKSAGFDFRQMQAAADPVERLCDQVAAEFLVPAGLFLKAWSENPDIRILSRKFKVSPVVIARRALDLGKFSKNDFFDFYNPYMEGFRKKKDETEGGGNFYATTRKRLSSTFAAHIQQAVETRQLLYRDAYKLTGLKGETFRTFFREHLV
jgi:Zn-dependent peptidase ImmA (M78 family)